MRLCTYFEHNSRMFDGVKNKAIQVQALRVPENWGYQFLDTRYMKVIMLSALPTGRLYALGDILSINFC